MLLEVFYLILGFAFLILGANLLVKGASNIAKKFYITEIIIGLTIVAIGTSAPELIITITSANKGAGELIIGNALGSNLCNLLLVLGLTAVIKPIKIDEQAKNIHIPISLFVTIIVLLMGISSAIDKIEGAILLILFIIYFSYPIIMQIKHRSNFHPNKKYNLKNVGVSIARPNRKNMIVISIIYVFIGIILLKYGGDFVVDNSITIARFLNLSEDIIGLTIIAFGTSLPELVTSIIAVIKGDENLAVGNIIGSCIFNLLLILGIGATIIPLKISSEFINNLIILIISTLLIWIFNFIGKKNYITRIKGAELLIIFVVYIGNLLQN